MGSTILNQLLFEFTEPLFEFLGTLLTLLHKLPLLLQSQPIHFHPSLHILLLLLCQRGQRLGEQERSEEFTSDESIVCYDVAEKRAERETVLFAWDARGSLRGRGGGASTEGG